MKRKDNLLYARTYHKPLAVRGTALESLNHDRGDSLGSGDLLFRVVAAQEAEVDRRFAEDELCRGAGVENEEGGVMGLYNFRPQFVAKILSGEKQHTIRKIRAVPDKPGNTLHLYTGLRRKGARLLMRVPCVRVEEIEIKDGAFFDENHASVVIDGVALDRSEREALARRDGFPDFETMMAFWRERGLPFKGHIIHWRFAKPARERVAA